MDSKPSISPSRRSSKVLPLRLWQAINIIFLMRFFLIGVMETASEAADAAQNLWILFDKDRRRIQEQGKIASTALRVHDLLQQRPIISITAACKALEVSHPAVNKSLRKMEEMNIVREITGRQRNRLYMYDAYMEILNEGMELAR